MARRKSVLLAAIAVTIVTFTICSLRSTSIPTIVIATGVFKLHYPSIFVSNLQSQVDAPGPDTCLSSSPTLDQLVTCLDNYIVPPKYYDSPRYNDAQPNTGERAAWMETVASLLNTDKNCTSITIPPTLANLYAITLFTESSGSSNSYCVLHETTSQDGVYSKGWGLMVVPATRRDVSRFIHVSAPHPWADMNTTQQAGALFKSAGAKSLLIPGRLRTAFFEPTDCISRGSSQEVYYKTDPAHDKLQPFYDANKVIWAWQNANGGCPGASCAFIQFHGKGSKTCSSEQMFLSSGLGNNPSSEAWYTDDVDRPVKRLKSQLKLAFPTWNITLPSDSSCALTATKNIIGRFLNGVDDSRVCRQNSDAQLAMGAFVHVEQSAAARAESAYEAWSEALGKTFEPDCDVGMTVGPANNRCE